MGELEIKLNKEQKEAVEYGAGPLLIVAGAGTGKTAVITQRIAHLIKAGLAKPEEILACTFTDKAAGEMEERVDRLLEIGWADLWVSTIHSFCERILRENGLDIGLSTDFKLVDQTSAWMLVRKNLDKFELDYYRPRGNPTRFLHALLNHFSRCKDQGISPKDYLKFSDSLKTNLTDLPEASEDERIKEVASAFSLYQKLLLDNNLLDFGDLINYCLELFEKRPHILKKYRQQFKYILVDEFQDVNFSQYTLIKMLAEPKNNLTVCADNFQAIYRFRGASLANILRFQKDFPKAKQVSLTANYRSCQNILDLSYQFISQNKDDQLADIDKKLKASSKEQGTIEHLHFKTLDDETQGVSNRIIEILKNDQEATLSDFAVLVRANDSANAFCRAFERAGIAYQFLASRGLYARPVVLDIIAYFKLLDNYREGTAVHRVLNLPFLDIDNQTIVQVNSYAKRKGQSVFDTLEENLSLVAGVSKEALKKINNLISLVEKHTKLAQEKNVSEVFLSFMRESGYLKFLLDKEKKGALSDLDLFYRKIKEFEESSLEPTLANFMEQMNLELESGERGQLEFDLNQGPDLVRVMTIHGAKGLEFKYIFLVNMVDRRFPSIERGEAIEIPEPIRKEEAPKGDVHLEEERRLCYVAMTRAKKGLFFTSAADYGGQRRKKLSRFMAEMGFEDKEQKSVELKKIEAQTKKKIDFILPDHFSFSQLANFSRCPLQYKYGYLLKVPVEGRAVFSFGTTMHNTLYQFLKQAEQGASQQKDLFGKDIDKKEPSFKDLQEIFEKKWIDEWYYDKKEQKEYYQLGKKIIKEFFEDFSKNPPAVLTINNQPALELYFRLKIGDYVITGRIDRIDKLENGVKIIDYKTGQAKDKLRPEDKEQLLIYQIAAEEAFGLNPIELSYYYLETGQEVSFVGSEQDKQKVKQGVIDKIKQIEKSEFSPTPGFHCQFCDFKDICDFAKL